MSPSLDFLYWLIGGAYVFTATVAAAGARAFFWLYRQITNHLDTRLRKLEQRVSRLERGPEP